MDGTCGGRVGWGGGGCEGRGGGGHAGPIYGCMCTKGGSGERWTSVNGWDSGGRPGLRGTCGPGQQTAGPGQRWRA